jgi:hypothetical protein
MTTYTYLGQRCTAVTRTANGKSVCIRGRNANMLVRFDDGRLAVVAARRLRKIPVSDNL